MIDNFIYPQISESYIKYSLGVSTSRVILKENT